MKVLNWIIALLGLWEFGDIAALFVPDFGEMPGFLWNHIIVGFVLMLVGVGAARASHARISQMMNWIAAGAGVWLTITSFILRYPVLGAGFWNDLIVGVIAFVFGVWTAVASSRTTE